MSKSKLALLGGSRTINKHGPHFPWPVITPSIESAVKKQLHESISIYDRSGIIAQFEDGFAKYHGKKFALLTSSGTAAIHSMFVAAGIKPDDEIICPAYTFYATATPLFHVGAIPVLCDADETGNIDPDRIEPLISPRTKGVVVTHMWGIPCKMDKILSLCRKHRLLLFEDTSHAHGAKYKDRLAGTWGDVSAWSLQGQKIISGGEGGILLTDDKEVYYRALLFGHYNKRCKQEIPQDHPLAKFSITGMGLKLRIHPLAAAIAKEQFSHLDDWIAQKEEYAKLMTDRLKKLPGIHPPKQYNNSQPSWYAYVFQYHEEELDGLSVERFFAALQAEGCSDADRPGSTCPLNLLPLFQDPSQLFPACAGKIKYSRGEFPVAESFFQKAIKLPVWCLPADRDIVNGYLGAIEKVVRYHKDLLRGSYHV